MARTQTLDAGCVTFDELAASGMTPAGLEEYKLDRLLELRAVITSMRLERGQELVADALAKACLDSRS